MTDRCCCNHHHAQSRAVAEARRQGAAAYIEAMYGKRCPEFDERCPCCTEWAFYDQWCAEIRRDA